MSERPPSDKRGDGDQLRIQIRVLGGFRVEIDGVPVDPDVWQRRVSPRSLLKLLAIDPTHRIHREQVLERLWPDVGVASAMGRFSKALYAARRAMAGAHDGSQRPIVFAHEIVSVDTAAVWFDIDHFESLARSALSSGSEAAVLEALAAYGGELLPEDRYEDWAAARRDQIEALHGDLLAALAGLYERYGRFTEAVPIWQQLVTRTPTFEPGHRALMRLYAATGARSRALQQYEKLRRLLEDELAAVPERETETLYRDLLAGRTSPPVEPQIPPPGVLPPAIRTFDAGGLLGRERIMDVLREDLAEVATGVGHVVVIEGEMGIGKSHLVAEIAHEAHARGFIALWGGAESPELLVPYGQFVNALEGHLVAGSAERLESTARRYPALVEIVPSLSGQVPPQDHELSPEMRQSRIVAGIQAFLSQVSARAPMLLVLDDFHHADAASVHLLYELAKAAPTHPWLVCLTVRTEGVRTGSPVGGLLPVLRQESLARYIELNRLSSDDTARVIEALLGSPAGGQAHQRIYALSLGNPLMTREVTLDMRESGRIHPVGEEWEISGEEEDHTPPSLRRILLGRLGRLGPEARNVMDVAAVLGFEFSLAELRSAVQSAFPSQTAEDLLLALDTALEHRFLFSQGETYAFTHPMVRLALIDAMPEHRRSHTHGAVARALETINTTDVDRLAFHFSQSYERDKAIEYLDRAATRAAGLYANVEAAAYYAELLRFVDEPSQPVEAAQVRLRLGRVLVRLGRYDDAVRELLQARERFVAAASYDDMAYVTSLIGDAYLHKGAPGEGEAVVSAVLGEYEGRVSPVARTTLYTMLSQLYFPLGRPHDQLAAAEEAERLTVSRVDEPHAHRLLGIAVTEHGAALMALGRTDEAEEYLMQALQINERSGTLLALSRAATALARLAGIAGDLDQEEAYLRMALKAAETLGSPSRVAFVLARLSRRATLIGNFAEAREYAERARIVDAENPSSSRTIVYLALAELAAAVGDAEAVRSFVDEGKSQADALQDIWFGAELEALDIEFQLLHRNPEGVPERLQALLEKPHLRPAYFRRLLAQAYVQLGHWDEAEAEIATAEDYARHVNDRLDLPAILAVRAALRASRGDFDDAQKLFDDGIDLARDMGLPRLEAMLLRARGTTARRNNRIALARSSLEAARQIFDRLGAQGVARLIQDELASLPDTT